MTSQAQTGTDSETPERTRQVLEDPARLAALARTGLLDSPPEEAFERLTRLAARLLHTPVALVSLVDGRRQFFKSQVGLAEPWASRRETPLAYSFCQFSVATGKTLVVSDARKHPQLQSSKAISEFGAIAYVGVPLCSDHYVLGELCVVDHAPRDWTEEELQTLTDLAAAVETEIRLRLAVSEKTRAAAEREAVLSQAAEGIIFTGPDGRIRFVNEAARQLHGVNQLDVPVEEYASTFHLLTMDGRPYPPDELPLARAVRHGETVRDARWRIRPPGEAEIIAEGSASPVQAPDGQRIGAVLVMRDITRDLEFLQQKDAFLSGLAHDLKNPIATIKGTAQLLARYINRTEYPSPERLTRSMEQIDTTATRVTSMLDELLDLSRLEMGREIDLRYQEADLLPVVRRVAEHHQQTTDMHAIRVETNLETLVGEWDLPRIERVLDNLVNNAIKYSPEGGEIVLKVATDEGPTAQTANEHTAALAEAASAGAGAKQVVISVSDQGIGIPEEDVPLLFQRYQRGSNVAGRFAGTGLGLTGARQIIEQHGGSIAIDSRLGDGTTITLRLPRRPSRSPGA